MSSLSPPLSATDGWVTIILNVVLVVVVVVALGAYPFVKWYAKRNKSGQQKK